MKKFAIALVALGFATPALAQNEPSLSGPWIAAVGGWDHVVLTDGSDSGTKSGVTYGGAIGYDRDFGTVVLGVEGELSGSSVKEAANNLLVAGDSAELKAGRDLYAGARLGFKVGPQIMIYGKAGYTNARATVSYTFGATTGTVSDNLDGYRLGAGVQYTQGHMFGRLEYRYSDYGDFRFDGVSTGISTGRHQVAVMAGYRF